MKTNQLAVQATAQLPLVEVKNQQAVTTSLQIAQTFGKVHYNVLQAIRDLECSKDFQALNFQGSFYNSQLANNGHKKLPMYYITRDGFTFLAMGFTGKVAAKFKEDYINAFNAMETKLREIQQKGLVSADCLQIEQQQTAFWKKQSDFWYNHCEQNTEVMGVMSANQFHLAELLRDKTENQPTGDYWRDMYTRTVEIVCQMSDNMQNLSRIVSKKTATPEVTSCNKVAGVKKQVQQLEAPKQITQPVAKKPTVSPKKEPKCYYSVVGYATLKNAFLGIKKAADLGRKASALCRAKGIKTEEIPDPRFGRIKIYPESVLEEVFVTIGCE